MIPQYGLDATQGGRKSKGRQNKGAETQLEFRPLLPTTASSDLDVEIIHVLRIPLDELAPGLDLVPHELVEDLRCLDRILHRHPKNRPGGRIHGCAPELIRVHLAQALVALDRDRALALAVG